MVNICRADTVLYPWKRRYRTDGKWGDRPARISPSDGTGQKWDSL